MEGSSSADGYCCLTGERAELGALLPNSSYSPLQICRPREGSYSPVHHQEVSSSYSSKVAQKGMTSSDLAVVPVGGLFSVIKRATLLSFTKLSPQCTQGNVSSLLLGSGSNSACSFLESFCAFHRRPWAPDLTWNRVLPTQWGTVWPSLLCGYWLLG